MKVIGLIGTIGAGKDTVANHLIEKYGYKSIGTGDLIRKMVSKEGKEPNRENCQKYQKEKREKEGSDFFSKKVAEEIKKNQWEKAIFNGVRIPEDAATLKKEFGEDAVIVLVDADPHLRFERLRKRKRIGDPKTFEEFKKQEKAEHALFNFKETLKYVDYTIKNEETYEELDKKVDELIKKIKFA